MPSFVRKNVVTLSTVFVAADGSATQPSEANAVITYNDQGGAAHQVSIGLTYNAVTGAWVGTWDTSASGEGTVDWMIYGFGTLQAAAQGCFEVYANQANNV
jgi:hypothetical protein